MRHGRRDATHRAIVEMLRNMGASVFDAGDVGGGFPDLVVGFRGQTYLLECKDAKGVLTERQNAFARAWRGAPFVVVRSPAEALRAIGLPDVAAQVAASCLRATRRAGALRTS